MAIYIIDEIMGRGKTTAMINHINKTGDEARFLFITPYLTEVSRIMDSCNVKHFCEPDENGGKLNNIKTLLRSGYNVVSTHALFGMLDPEALGIIADLGYTLIMDEVTCVIDNIGASSYDIKIMMDEYVKIDETGLVTWAVPDYTGKLEEYKDKIMQGGVYAYNDNNWLRVMHPSLFASFTDVYIMTYMFAHQIQRCYFDMNDLQYQRIYVSGNSPESYCLSDVPGEKISMDYRKLIHIVDNDRLNRIGDHRTSLSKGWYLRNAKTKAMTEMRNNLYNFFRNHAKTRSCDNLWTVFCKDETTGLDWQDILRGSGYSKGFLSCNARGTNQYRDRHSAAYIINRYPNTCIKNFLERNGIHLDQDFFALSEMLQWIWRTAIRDGEPITLYIPSKRMRTLLINWIEEVSK